MTTLGQRPVRSYSMAGMPTPVPAKIERALVLTVNTDEYTVDVRTEFTYTPRLNISFMVPYAHHANGEGINFMPEVGSTCWLATPSEEGLRSFVMGWTVQWEEGSFRSGRPLLNPGDLHFSTRDGNFLAIRRGGIVQIGSGPVCQRIYIPIRNYIRDMAENYGLHTPGGDLTWEVARTDEDADGHRGTSYTLACKEFADDPNEKPVAFLKFGSHGSSDDTILTLQTRDKGGGVEKTTLKITKTGDVSWKIERNVTLDITGDLVATMKGKMEATAQSMKLTSKSTLEASAPTAITLASGGTQLALAPASAKLKAPMVEIGQVPIAPALRNSVDFVTWMAQVTAALNVLGPVPGFSGALLPPTQHFNPQVKV